MSQHPDLADSSDNESGVLLLDGPDSSTAGGDPPSSTTDPVTVEGPLLLVGSASAGTSLPADDAQVSTSSTRHHGSTDDLSSLTLEELMARLDTLDKLPINDGNT